jgi:hypothetical protein
VLSNDYLVLFGKVDRFKRNSSSLVIDNRRGQPLLLKPKLKELNDVCSKLFLIVSAFGGSSSSFDVHNIVGA